MLIGEQWLEDPHGRRRLLDKADIVRLEIELAIQHDVPLIPLLVDDAPFPVESDLPNSIRDLVRFKGYPLANAHWDAQLAVLLEAVSSVTQSHVPTLRRGVGVWNQWRADNPDVQPMLAHARLHSVDVTGADLSNADFRYADLQSSILREVNLSDANLEDSNLRDADLTRADLHGARLAGADLREACLQEARLSEVDLRHVNLNGADLSRTMLDRSHVYGVSVWGAKLLQARQRELLLTGPGDREITVDDIETAVLLNLLMSGGTRGLIDSLTSKVVLILGRFTEARKTVLDAVRDELLSHNLIPVLFDFEAPADRDISETMTLLAHMARFVVADLSDPASIPMELQRIASEVAVPIQTVIQEDQEPFAMFADLMRYPWVLEPYRYRDLDDLLAKLETEVIAPAEAKRKALKTGSRLD